MSRITFVSIEMKFGTMPISNIYLKGKLACTDSLKKEDFWTSVLYRLPKYFLKGESA